MGNCGVGFAPARPDAPRLAHRAAWRASRTSPAPRWPRACPGTGRRSPSTSTRSTAGRGPLDVGAQVPHAAAARVRHGRARRRPDERATGRGDRPDGRAGREAIRAGAARLRHPSRTSAAPHEHGLTSRHADRRRRRAARHRRGPRPGRHGRLPAGLRRLPVRRRRPRRTRDRADRRLAPSSAGPCRSRCSQNDDRLTGSASCSAPSRAGSRPAPTSRPRSRRAPSACCSGLTPRPTRSCCRPAYHAVADLPARPSRSPRELRAPEVRERSCAEEHAAATEHLRGFPRLIHRAGTACTRSATRPTTSRRPSQRRRRWPGEGRGPLEVLYDLLTGRRRGRRRRCCTCRS